jgi:class 3 adenylate cyclase
MALFGLDDQADSTFRAARAGLVMLRTVEILKPYFHALFRRSFDIRIGLHYGCVVVGSVGFQKNQATTVIGDAVNFASRIEAANKQTGTRFLISKAARSQLARRMPTRPHGPLKIPGKKGRHTLYEIVAD